MKATKLGTRGMVFEFQDPYPHYGYVIDGIETVFVCDTACGPESMEPVLKHIQDIGASGKDVVVFNTHAHYDHFWGNCSFPGAMIISHRLCRDTMPTLHAEALKNYGDHMRGEVELVLPNVVFDERLEFIDERVVFFHSSGHTADSSACLDLIDKVLIVGDNVETPVPYLYEYNIDEYITSLKVYLDTEWTHLVSGHDPVQTNRELVSKNLEYLKEWSEWEVDLDKLDEHGRGFHIMNLAELAEKIPIKSITPKMLAYYKIAKERLEKQEQTPEIEALLEKIRNITSIS